MEAPTSSKTSVTVFNTTRCHNSEYHNANTNALENFKANIFVVVVVVSVYTIRGIDMP
jgi:hypothetical protein